MKLSSFFLLLIPMASPPLVADSPHSQLMHDAYSPAVLSAEKQRRSKARVRLNQMGVKRLEPLMDFIHTQNIAIRIDAYLLVRKKPHDGKIEILATYLEHPSARTRSYAAFFLSLMDAPELSDQVRPLLNDPDTAGSAARALGKWNDREAIPGILKLLKHREERRVIQAINALRDIGNPSTVTNLLPFIDHPQASVRYPAERALIGLGTNAAPQFIKSLPTASPRAKRHLVRALGSLRVKTARPLLESMREVDDWGLKGDVLRALKSIAAGPQSESETTGSPHEEDDDLPAWLRSLDIDEQ